MRFTRAGGSFREFSLPVADGFDLLHQCLAICLDHMRTQASATLADHGKRGAHRMCIETNVFFRGRSPPIGYLLNAGTQMGRSAHIAN